MTARRRRGLTPESEKDLFEPGKRTRNGSRSSNDIACASTSDGNSRTTQTTSALPSTRNKKRAAINTSQIEKERESVIQRRRVSFHGDLSPSKDLIQLNDTASTFLETHSYEKSSRVIPEEIPIHPVVTVETVVPSTEPQREVKVNTRLNHFATKVIQNAALREKRLIDDEIKESNMKKTFSDVSKDVVISKRATKTIKKNYKHAVGKDNPWLVAGGIHLDKKKLDLHGVIQEFKKHRRSEFYRQMTIYLFFLYVLFGVVSWIPIKETYEQNDAVAQLLCKNDPPECNMSNLGDIYRFMSSLSRHICPQKRTASKESKQPWVCLSTFHARQVKILPQVCSGFGDHSHTCYPLYAASIEDKQTFVGVASNVSYTWSDHYPSLTTSFNYNRMLTWSPSPTLHFGTGGYQVDLCHEDVDMPRQLLADEWITLSTRAISLDFVLYNPTTEIFTIGLHVFAIQPSGYVNFVPLGANLRLLNPSMTTFLENTNQSKDAKMLVFTFVLAGFLVAYIVAEYYEVQTMGLWVYVLDFWNLFSIVQFSLLILLIGSILKYLVKSLQIQTELEVSSSTASLSKVSRREEVPFIRFQHLLADYSELVDYLSLSAALGFLKIFKFLRMNKTMNLLWQVLGMAAKDLLGFLVIFVLIFISYALMGYVGFGHYLFEFSSIYNSFGTCFKMLAGDYDFYRLQQANPRLGPFFFGTFVIMVLLVLVNVFVAILSEYYESAREHSRENDSDVEYDIFSRIWSYLQSLSPHVIVNGSKVIELKNHEKVHLISTHLLDEENKRESARKKFRSVVWRIVALMRIGVKFDQRFPLGLVHQLNSQVKKKAYTDILLSANFDHTTITNMLPPGCIIMIKGHSVIRRTIFLTVLQHDQHYTECQVTCPPGDDMPIELLGGEMIQIPWKYFVRFFVKSALSLVFHFLASPILRRERKVRFLVDDYHLNQLFQEAIKEGYSSLRYDEVQRQLGMLLRKDRNQATVTNDTIRKQTAMIMVRFRSSLIDMPSREAEGHNYKPKPHDTSKISIQALEPLVELLAENCHDLWARDRIRDGWVWGIERDDPKKKHPNLVPYHRLSREEKDYDRRTAIETLKTVCALQFEIIRSTEGGASSTNNSIRSILSNVDESCGSVLYDDDEEYTPKPTATDHIKLPLRLISLADLIAENIHEVWSDARMKAGWIYGPWRDDRLKLHPCLVPYIFLTDSEKEYDLNTAIGTLKTLIALGFSIHDRSKKA